MIRIFALLLAFVSASPVDALSCVRTDIAYSYQRAAESEKQYIVVLGTFTFKARKLPRVDWDNQQDTPQDTFIQTQFSGTSLTRDGFTNAFSSPVMLSANCFGPWCSSLVSNTQALAFVEKTSDGYLVTTNPCGGFVFQNPRKDQINQIVACHQGKRCDPQ